MSDVDDAIAAAAARYHVPVALLKGVAQQESGMNPNQGDSHIAPAVGTERATGIMQITPTTARTLNINPRDWRQAVNGGAAYLAEGYAKTGNWDDAVRYYHGGPNTKLWGPRTQDYHEKVAGHAQRFAQAQPDAPQGVPQDVDTFDAALGGAPVQNGAPAAPAQDHDTFDAAVNAATTSPHDGLPSPPLAAGGGQPGDNGHSSVPDGSAGQGGSPGSPEQLADRTWGQWAAGLDPLTDKVFNGGSWLEGAQNRGAGVLSGIATVPQFLLNAAGNVVDATSPKGNKPGAWLHSTADSLRDFAGSGAANKGAGTFQTGELAGMGLSTAPVAELNLIRAAPEGASLLTKGLTIAGNRAAQGAAAGAVNSGGHDIALNAAAGAVLAPVLGAVGSKILPKVIATGEGTAAVAKALKSRIADMARTPGTTQAEINAVTDAAGVARFDAKATLDYFKAHPADTRLPGVVTNKSVAEGLGARGSRTGISSTKDLPPAAQAHYDRLTSQGVDPQEALREADILAVPGAKPTVAAVTRNPHEQSALWEGAKVSTPEGAALNAQLAQNNAALHTKVQNVVESHGGVPSQGEAAQTAAASLAKASDAERAKVAALYQKAQKADPGATVSIDPLRELLATPRFKSPTDAASRELISGMNSLAKSMSKDNRNRFSPDQIEELRKAANAAYDRMGGSVNGTVGDITKALDASLDQLDNTSAAFKAARAAHRKWAAQYQDPKGVSNLIRRDAQGNFVNEDNWRSAGNIFAKQSDKDAIQVIKQLQNDPKALARLKAHVVQQAYEHATTGAGDAGGHATFNGSRFLANLDKIGSAKLNALFSKQELAELASTGRAAIALNEAVPGTANTSNTASKLADALRGTDKVTSLKGKIGKAAAHAVVGPLTHGLGNVAIEAGGHAVAAAGNRKAASALAKALTEQMSPETARAARAAEAQRLATAMRRRSTATSITKRAGSVAGALTQSRK